LNSKITYKETDKDLIAEITPDPKRIIKFGILFFYTLPFVIILILGFYIFLDRPSKFFDFDSDTLMISGMIIISLILIRVFLKRIFQKEILHITSDTLTFSKKFLFKTNKRTFRLDQISDLKIAGKENFTKHPLDTQGFDYLGIGTGEKELQFLIEDGTLSFFYSGSTVRFGKNVYDDEGEELLEKIKKRC
jgi:hypothetical protein